MYFEPNEIRFQTWKHLIHVEVNIFFYVQVRNILI
jgi:hypothetical protein